MRLRISKFLCQTEIDDVHLVAALPNAHQEIVWLNIAMDKVTRMHIFDARDLKSGLVNEACGTTTSTHQLIGQQQNSFQAELAVAEIE